MSRARRPHHRLLLRRLLRREEGGIATILAFVILPLMALAGLAIDVSTAYWVYDRMRYALDGAALAAGHATDATEAQQDSERYFEANFEAGFVQTTLADFSTNFDPDSGSVEVEATVEMPTSFMRLFGFEMLPISARALVRRGGSNLELVMVLDTTGSMGSGGKIQALKDAATEMLDIMFAGRSEIDGLWVGAVPFASRVNVGRADWLNVPEPADWPGCYDPRSGTNAVDDTSPSVESFPVIGANAAGADHVDEAYDRCPDPRLLPLTPTRSEIDALVASLVARGRTNITYATAWGWRAISEDWQGLWGDPELPHANDQVQKVVVLMTDGQHVVDPLIDTLSKQEMDHQLAEQCELMKAEGIVIYTIMFQAPGSLRPLFQGCASSATHHYFDLQHNEQLVEAFGAIGKELTELYLAE